MQLRTRLSHLHPITGSWPAIAVLALSLCGPAIATAEVIDDLYEARTPVEDRGDAARRAGLARLVGLVAVKLTGRRQAAEIEAVVKAGEAPDSLIVQYEYRQPATPGAATSLDLWARLDKAPT